MPRSDTTTFPRPDCASSPSVGLCFGPAGPMSAPSGGCIPDSIPDSIPHSITEADSVRYLDGSTSYPDAAARCLRGRTVLLAPPMPRSDEPKSARRVPPPLFARLLGLIGKLPSARGMERDDVLKIRGGWHDRRGVTGGASALPRNVSPNGSCLGFIGPEPPRTHIDSDHQNIDVFTVRNANRSDLCRGLLALRLSALAACSRSDAFDSR